MIWKYIIHKSTKIVNASTRGREKYYFVFLFDGFIFLFIVNKISGISNKLIVNEKNYYQYEIIIIKMIFHYNIIFIVKMKIQSELCIQMS